MSELQLQGLLSISNSTMRRPTVKSCCCNERKMTIFSKENKVKHSIKIAKAALPAACVVIAGPAVSCFPLGSFAPILAILAASLAGAYSDNKFIGVSVVLIQGCGLRGFEGRMLALLSFLSFSSMFDKLDKSLQVSSKGFSSVIGIIHSAFAGAFLSAHVVSLKFLHIMAFAMHGLYTNTLMRALQSFSTSWNKTSTSPLGLIAQTPDGLHSIEDRAEEDGDSSDPRQNIPSDMSQEVNTEYPPTNATHKALSEDLLANCETIKEHQTQKGSCLDNMDRGNSTLTDQVIRIIDECDGTLSSEEWDEIIAALY